MRPLLPLLVAIAIAAAQASIRIVSQTPADGAIVKRGRSVTLSCKTDRRWFFCLWRSPANDKSCAIQQASTSPPMSVCRADRRIRMTPTATSCDIQVSFIIGILSGKRGGSSGRFL